MVECYCHGCCKALCTECIYQEDHNSHKFEDIHQVIQASECSLKERLKTQRNDYIDEDVIQCLNNAIDNVKKTSNEIVMHAEAIREALNTVRCQLDDAATKMDSHVAREVDKLRKYQQTFMQERDMADQMSTVAENLLACDSDPQVITCAKRFAEPNDIERKHEISFPVVGEEFYKVKPTLIAINDQLDTTTKLECINVTRGAWNLETMKTVVVTDKICGIILDRKEQRIVVRTMDKNGPIKVYSMDLELIHELGSGIKDLTKDLWDDKHGIGIDPVRNLYLLPCYSGALVRLDKNGDLKDKTKLSGNIGDVTYLSNEDIYAVSDISTFRLYDNILLIDAEKLAIDKKLYNPNCYVDCNKICSGQNNGKSVILGCDVESIMMWENLSPDHTSCYADPPDTIGKPSRPLGICLDKDGKCVVCDNGHKRLLRIWKEAGKTHWECLLDYKQPDRYPVCIDIDNHNRLAVVGTQHAIHLYNF